MIRPGATAIVVGIAPRGAEARVPALELLSEKALRGSYYGSGNATVEIARLGRLMADGRLEVADAVSHLTDLDGIEEAFERLRRGSGARTVAVIDATIAGAPDVAAAAAGRGLRAVVADPPLAARVPPSPRRRDRPGEHPASERRRERVAVGAERADAVDRREGRADLVDERARARAAGPGRPRAAPARRARRRSRGAASRQRPIASARRQARKPIEGTSFWPKPPSESSVGPASARASSAQPVWHHVQRLHRPLVAGEQRRRRRVLQQLVGQALGELAQVGPHDRPIASIAAGERALW